jgi:glutamine amidotransferase
MITIIDYGLGNLASIQNMLGKCGFSSQISRNPDVIRKATKLILPGVGAFDSAMKKINEAAFDSVIKEVASSGRHILGICLGAQLLMQDSEEGTVSGLSLIKGNCKKFNEKLISPLRVPHMGWSDVKFVKPTHPLTRFNEMEPRFYFTHSYYLHCYDPVNILASSTYGHEFTCCAVQDNIMGVQFHPEKSHAFGAQLLTNFARM